MYKRQVLVVAEPSVSGMSDMERIIHTAKNFGIKIAVCVNKYDTNIDLAKKIEHFCKEQGLPFVGRIPFDANAVRAMNDGKMCIRDRYETIRLIDFDGFTQEECAKQMNVARTTIQGIYSEARKKLAEFLVEGKILSIEGGEYRLCEGLGKGCGRGCRRRNRGRCFAEDER